MLYLIWLKNNWKLVGTGGLIVALAIWIGSLYLERGVAQGRAAKAEGQVSADVQTINELRAEIAIQNAAVDKLQKDGAERQAAGILAWKNSQHLSQSLTYAADAANERISALLNVPKPDVAPIVPAAHVVSMNGCMRAIADSANDLRRLAK